MKLVIATALAASFAAMGLAAAQEAGPPDPALQSSPPPPLRGAADGAADGGLTPGGPAAPAPDPAVQEMKLAEARTAALSAATLPGATDDPLIRKVADYALFQRDLAAVEDRELAEPTDLDAVMDTLAGYDSRTLSDAFLSYAAMIAAQQPAFVDRVREVADYYGEGQLIQGMLNEPDYALSFPGAQDAARLVLGVLSEDLDALEAVGGQFKQESYDLQSEGWSNLVARDREDRLADIGNPQRVSAPSRDLIASLAYGTPITASEPAATAELRRTAFWNAIAYRPDPVLQSRPAAAVDMDSEALGVVMSLAALRALNASAARPDLVSYLLEIPSARACLDFALLHMQQCVAAAHFKYEDAFCIAEHQINDARRCLGETVNMVAIE